MRVLGFAFKIVPLDFEFDSQFLIPCSGFTMTALVCIMDPPRPEAIVAIKQAQDAGICLKMIDLQGLQENSNKIDLIGKDVIL